MLGGPPQLEPPEAHLIVIFGACLIMHVIGVVPEGAWNLMPRLLRALKHLGFFEAQPGCQTLSKSFAASYLEFFGDSSHGRGVSAVLHMYLYQYAIAPKGNHRSRM
jgi:hypothetical protein